MRSAKRRKEYLTHQGHSHNLRSAVEATVRSVKHPFEAGKLPVRGQFRVTYLTIASAAIANVRRIQRYHVAKKKASLTAQNAPGEPGGLPEAGLASFLLSSRLPWPYTNSRFGFQPEFWLLKNGFLQ